MKKLTAALSMLLAFVVMAMLVMSGCSTTSDSGTDPNPTPFPTGNGVLSGSVIDESGRPIQGAGVEIFDAAVTPSRENPTGETDQNGQFSFSNLATGVNYLLFITYEGRVTLQPNFIISADTQVLTFEITMPLGDGVASFDLPSCSTLNTPVMTGRSVALSWTHRDKATPVYEGYYLYRSETAGVTPNNTLLDSNTLYGSTTCTDTLPTSGGSYFYRLFESYIVSDMSVRIVLSSNEVSAYTDKYIFSQKWTKPTSTGPEDPPLEFPFGLALWEANGDTTVFVTDVIGAFSNPQYMFKIVNDGPLTPFFQAPSTVGLSKYSDDFYGVKGITVDSAGLGYFVGYVGDTSFLIVGNQDGTLRMMYETPWGEEWTNVAVTTSGQTRTIYLADAYGWDGYGEVDIYEWNGTDPTMSEDNEVDEWDYDELGGTPYAIAADAAGNVYVSTFTFIPGPFGITFTGAVKKYDANMTLLLTITGSGETNGNFSIPMGLALDPAGNIYVGDSNVAFTSYAGGILPTNPMSRIMKFDPEGTFITQFGSYAASPLFGITQLEPSQAADGTFTTPTGIAVDSNESVYVADPLNYRVQKFVLTEQN